MTPADEGGVRKFTASCPALREMHKAPLPAEGKCTGRKLDARTAGKALDRVIPGNIRLLSSNQFLKICSITETVFL